MSQTLNIGSFRRFKLEGKISYIPLGSYLISMTPDIPKDNLELYYEGCCCNILAYSEKKNHIRRRPLPFLNEIRNNKMSFL